MHGVDPGFGGLFVFEVSEDFIDLDHGRSEDDEEDGGEDEEECWEEDFGGGFLCHRFGVLLAFESECFGEFVEGSCHAGAVFFGGHDDSSEILYFGEVGAIAKFLERFGESCAELDFAFDDAEFSGEERVGGLEFFDDAYECGDEAKSAAEADDDEVAGIGESSAESSLTFGFATIEPEAGCDHSEDADHGAADQCFFHWKQAAEGSGDGHDEWAGNEKEFDTEEGGHCSGAVETGMQESGGEFGAFSFVCWNESFSDFGECGLDNLSDVMSDVLFVGCGSGLVEGSEPHFGAFGAFSEQHIEQAGEAAGHSCSEEYGNPHETPIDWLSESDYFV